MPKQLLQSAKSLVIMHWFCLVGVGLWVKQAWPIEIFTCWLTTAFLVLGFVHFQLFYHLKLNHSPGKHGCYPSMGLANHITLARGWGISLIAGFIFLPIFDPAFKHSPASWVPGILYLLVACADFIDGLLARLTKTTSVLGRKLDVEMDALGLLTVSVLTVVWGRLPVAYLLVGFSYYLFQFGKWHLGRRGQKIDPLIERPFARVMAGIQMVFVGLALLPLFAVPRLHLAAVCFMLPFLVGFIWDWLIIQGRPVATTRDSIKRLAGRVAPVLPAAARGIIFFSFWSIAEGLKGSGSSIIDGIWLVLASMMVIGFLGRSAAIIAACLLAHTAFFTGIPSSGVTFSACLVLIVTGTGRLSWWKPEDDIMARRLGGENPFRTERTVQIRGEEPPAPGR